MDTLSMKRRFELLIHDLKHESMELQKEIEKIHFLRRCEHVKKSRKKIAAAV